LLGYTLSLPIQKSTIKTMPLPIQKLAANYAAADSEISNKKQSRCQIKNWQSKILPQPIQKLTERLLHCRFRNRQPKTLPLPIQKLAAKPRSCRFRNWQPKT
jgi:hypothetical protein